jgi:hypothetical protein
MASPVVGCSGLRVSGPVIWPTAAHVNFQPSSAAYTVTVPSDRDLGDGAGGVCAVLWAQSAPLIAACEMRIVHGRMNTVRGRRVAADIKMLDNIKMLDSSPY